MGFRRKMEILAWRLAGFKHRGKIHRTSRIKLKPNPLEIVPRQTDRFLVLSPHPDDDLIGCGGLICRSIKSGAAVLAVYVTDGALGGDPAVRRKEVASARSLLSESLNRTFEVRFLDHRDGEIDGDRFSIEIADILGEFAPTAVFLPHAADNHRDHYAVHFHFCRTAFRANANPSYKVFGYEIWDTLTPDAYVDISDVGSLKRSLIEEHRSQSREKPYADMLLGLNVYRAISLPGSMYLAEAFEIIRGG